MLCRNFVTKLTKSRRFFNTTYSIRFCENKSIKNTPKKDEDEKDETPLGSMASKYVPFREEDSQEILDIHEERLKYIQLQEERELEDVDPFKGINLESIYLTCNCLNKHCFNCFFRRENWRF